MTPKQTITPEEISAIVDGFDPIDWEEMELMKKMPPEQRWLVGYRKTEALRADLRNKLIKDFPELSMPEINMKILRSFTPVRMGKSYTEPAYHEHFTSILDNYGIGYGINPLLSSFMKVG